MITLLQKSIILSKYLNEECGLTAEEFLEAVQKTSGRINDGTYIHATDLIISLLESHPTAIINGAVYWSKAEELGVEPTKGWVRAHHKFRQYYNYMVDNAF